MLPDQMIFEGGDVAWPARPPDLSIYEYFLWGYLKSRVFLNKPNDISELKASYTAVSYTHLDVYKRQAPPRKTNMFRNQ